MTELTGEDLAYATLDHIREHPEEWNQRHYTCGFTACFAGRAIILSLGEEALADASRHPWEETETAGPGHILTTAGVIARRLLGWTKTQAGAVFFCNADDFDVLEGVVKKVLSGEIG